jgi:hypothetical protein
MNGMANRHLHAGQCKPKSVFLRIPLPFTFTRTSTGQKRDFGTDPAQEQPAALAF